VRVMDGLSKPLVPAPGDLDLAQADRASLAGLSLRQLGRGPHRFSDADLALPVRARAVSRSSCGFFVPAGAAALLLLSGPRSMPNAVAHVVGYQQASTEGWGRGFRDAGLPPPEPGPQGAVPLPADGGADRAAGAAGVQCVRIAVADDGSFGRARRIRRPPHRENAGKQGTRSKPGYYTDDFCELPSSVNTACPRRPAAAGRRKAEEGKRPGQEPRSMDPWGAPAQAERSVKDDHRAGGRCAATWRTRRGGEGGAPSARAGPPRPETSAAAQRPGPGRQRDPRQGVRHEDQPEISTISARTSEVARPGTPTSRTSHQHQRPGKGGRI